MLINIEINRRVKNILWIFFSFFLKKKKCYEFSFRDCQNFFLMGILKFSGSWEIWGQIWRARKREEPHWKLFEIWEGNKIGYFNWIGKFRKFCATCFEGSLTGSSRTGNPNATLSRRWQINSHWRFRWRGKNRIFLLKWYFCSWKLINFSNFICSFYCWEI